MTYQELLVEHEAGIVTVALNRPDVRNVISDDPLMTELTELCAVLDANLSVKVVIITGAGTAFSAGGNVAKMRNGEGMFAGPAAATALGYQTGIQRLIRAVHSLRPVTIASVNGPAMGAGFDLALACDLRICATSAKFGETFVNLGLIPGDGGTYSLPRVVGTQRALDMIWTGKMITAQEALEIGYALAVYEPEELMPRVTEYAKKIANGPGVAVQLSKKLVYRSANIPFDEHLDMAQMAMFIAQSTEDAREGPRAFVEKREPQFKGS